MLIGIKHLIARTVPPSLRQQLRRWYHPRVVASFSEERWPPAAGVRQLVRRGDVVVDAGANVGYVTALLAKWVGPTGRVFSFEPVPITADLLKRSVARLGLKQVQVLSCGVSDREGSARMAIPRYADGSENLYESKLLEEAEEASNLEAVAVPLRRLDDVLQEDRNRLTFMKIDVEGHEEAALRGGLNTLREVKPALLIEIMGNLDEPESSAGRVLALLSELGYAPYFWESGWRARHLGEAAVDYFFLTTHHLEMVK